MKFCKITKPQKYEGLKETHKTTDVYGRKTENLFAYGLGRLAVIVASVVVVVSIIIGMETLEVFLLCDDHPVVAIDELRLLAGCCH